MTFTDPIAFEEFLAPAGGEVCIRPMTGTRFRASLDLRLMKRVALFTVEAGSFSAQKAPQQDFYGISIPLNAPFTVSEPGYDQTFGRANAHLLSPGNPFNFMCESKCHAMACNIFVAPLEAYKERMLQEPSTASENFLNPHVSLIPLAGNGLFRSIVRAWVSLGSKYCLDNEIILQEMEDDLLASFLLLTEDSHAFEKEAALPTRYALKHTEDYICANLDAVITRDELADKAGVSIRSLSRAFKVKYGLGPMAFVRQRRLDACYALLRGSASGQTTVTEVAMSHGFGHIGKFAIAYKMAFGESPSASLLG